MTLLTSWRRRTSSDDVLNIFRRGLTTTADCAERCVATVGVWRADTVGRCRPTIDVSGSRPHGNTFRRIELRGTSTGRIVCSSAAVHRVTFRGRRHLFSAEIVTFPEQPDVPPTSLPRFLLRRSTECGRLYDWSVSADYAVDNYVVVRCF